MRVAQLLILKLFQLQIICTFVNKLEVLNVQSINIAKVRNWPFSPQFCLRKFGCLSWSRLFLLYISNISLACKYTRGGGGTS